MKIDDFPMVEALVSTRNYLTDQREQGRIAIEINGRRLAPEVTERVKPAIIAELDRQIGELDKQLTQLGGDVA